MSTRDWATWTARAPKKARHHSLARPSVWGRAWQTRQIGAATTSRIDERQADDVGGEHDDGEHGDHPAEEHHEDAAVGERAEDELAEHDGGLGGVDALAEDGLGERVGGRDGQAGQAEAGVDGDGGDDDAGEDVFDGGAGLERLVAHDDRPADQARTGPGRRRRCLRSSATARPTRLWAVTLGVASRVWPSRVRIGLSAAVTRSRNQPSMAASMWPVMSNRPGEGWLPPLTVPPLPGAGVVGVVVPPGRPGCPAGPSPEPTRSRVVVRGRSSVDAVWSAVANGHRSARSPTGGVWPMARGVALAPGEHGHERRAPATSRSRGAGAEPAEPVIVHPPTIEARMDTSSGAKMARA